MDLETENRLAAMLLKEAAELRRQAEREGALSYLRKPTVRARPNSRFLTSTVLGVQQANRAVEISEMWRARQSELDLDNKHKGRCTSRHDTDQDSVIYRGRHDSNDKFRDLPCSSIMSKENEGGYDSDDRGLRDEEIEEFLRSRIKRGRGSIGSRVDETGPYLSHPEDSQDDRFVSYDHYGGEKRRRIILGPEKPSSRRSYESSEEDDDINDVEDGKKRKKRKSKEKTHHSKKRKSKERSKKEKKKSRHEKKHK